jgi:hypothetical protein
MSVPLEEALRLVKLEPGRTSCRVNGWEVEVRVRPVVPAPESALNESDVMLDAWAEFPDPAPAGTVLARLVPPPPPDIPEIPAVDRPE